MCVQIMLYALPYLASFLGSPCLLAAVMKRCFDQKACVQLLASLLVRDLWLYLIRVAPLIALVMELVRFLVLAGTLHFVAGMGTKLARASRAQLLKLLWMVWVKQTRLRCYQVQVVVLVAHFAA